MTLYHHLYWENKNNSEEFISANGLWILKTVSDWILNADVSQNVKIESEVHTKRKRKTKLYHHFQSDSVEYEYFSWILGGDLAESSEFGSDIWLCLKSCQYHTPLIQTLPTLTDDPGISCKNKNSLKFFILLKSCELSGIL